MSTSRAEDIETDETPAQLAAAQIATTNRLRAECGMPALTPEQEAAIRGNAGAPRQ